MKILRFPSPAKTAGDPARRGRSPSGTQADADSAGAKGSASPATRDDRHGARMLWIVAALHRPLIETVLAQRGPARGILAQFRRTDGCASGRD